MDDDNAPAADSAPPYRHIADVLRGEILDGRYQVGERIPAQADLEQRFGVSRPTIQRALGVLRESGFIDNQRGRSAEVLPWRARGADAAPTGAEGPQPAFAALAEHVADAFQEREVTIDAFSLTAETLNTALSHQLHRIQTGEVRSPDFVRIRLLLPAPDARLAYPRSVADPEDERPLRRLRDLIRGHCIAMRSSFNSTQRLTHLQGSLEFRTVPITPLHKLYLINKSLALLGYYKLVNRPIMFDEQWEDMYDVLGIDAQLFLQRRDVAEPEAVASRFVSEAQEWFDSLWSTIAEPMKLFT